MKKLLSLALALLMLASVATVALASTTTLTTTVPPATYTLNIPADQEIPFGETGHNIGNVTVTDAAGFAEGKNLKVTMDYDAFTCEGVSTTIPFSIECTGGPNDHYSRYNIHELTFRGNASSSVSNRAIFSTSGSEWTCQNMYAKITSTDWGKALAGDYTATITFTAEVVAE